MEVTDFDYQYCLSKPAKWPHQCSSCKRNIYLYKYQNQPLNWINSSNQKVCLNYKKLQLWVESV